MQLFSQVPDKVESIFYFLQRNASICTVYITSPAVHLAIFVSPSTLFTLLVNATEIVTIANLMQPIATAFPVIFFAQFETLDVKVNSC